MGSLFPACSTTYLGVHLWVCTFVYLGKDILDGTNLSMVVIFIVVLKFSHMSSTEENFSALNNLL